MPLPVSIGLALLAAVSAATPSVPAAAPQASRGTMLSFDFEAAAPAWATPAVAGVGTVIVEGGKDGSRGQRLAVDAKAAAGNAWRATLASGPLAVTNDEANLDKLTLAFMLSASSARPVTVRVESFDANRRSTGALASTIDPAAPDFYQRYALDLSTMKPAGGAFDPKAPFVGLTFEVGAAEGWASGAAHEVCVDDVHYARPSIYLAPNGDDKRDGATEATALLTFQKAVDAAKPGDIIAILPGEYPSGRSRLTFAKGGAPAAWVSVRGMGEKKPTLHNETWDCVKIGMGTKEEPATGPAVAYIEIRNVHIRGIADVADKKYPEFLDKSDGRTNGNGISVEGRYEAHVPHHLRFADNFVELNCGGGISAIEGDWTYVERNVSRDNCWWMIYAGSGISLIGASNFDVTTGYKRLIRDNVVSGNHCNLKWKKIDRYSDGNGIILDLNRRTSTNPTGAFTGRTLVQGNLSFGNGGSGIHAFEADHVDIINNTAYMNSSSPHLEYPQIFANHAEDVRIINNILVAPVANVQAGEKPEPVNGSGKGKGVVYANNVYFGGNKPPFLGAGDRIADPKFVKPTTRPAESDFRLKPNSPARSTNATTQPSPSPTPIRDLDGKPLPTDRVPDAGAYQR